MSPSMMFHPIHSATACPDSTAPALVPAGPETSVEAAAPTATRSAHVAIDRLQPEEPAMSGKDIFLKLADRLGLDVSDTEAPDSSNSLTFSQIALAFRANRA